MTSRVAVIVRGSARDITPPAVVLAVAVMCLLVVVKLSWAAQTGGLGQVLFTAALFVLPLLYTVPSSRRLLARHRWWVLAVQAVLTWVPFAVFGGRWVTGLGGLLAGLVLLMLAGLASWLLAGLLLAADVLVRATVTGLEFAPAWSGVLWAVISFIDDGLWFFAMMRMAQIVGEVEQARRQSAELAATRERLQASRALQGAVGEPLAGIAAAAAAARQSLSRDAAHARARIEAAGVAAREAIARARVLSANLPGQSAVEPAGEASIGSRLAWVVLVVILCAYTAQGINNVVLDHDGLRLGVLLVCSYLLSVALQLRHSWWASQGGRPRAWPLTLALQAVLAYMFFLPSLAGFMTDCVFVPGSALLLLRGRARWAAYAAVMVSWSIMYATVPLHGLFPRNAFVTVYEAANLALIGLLIYGLSRLAGLAREMESLRGELARVAAVGERLRVARDVHDLLGLGLSAIALKADLITALIDRDTARAAAEIAEMSRVCAAARADIRLVTVAGGRLSPAAEVDAAKQILTFAGIKVTTNIPEQPLPALADEVLTPVLREAVTNVLRHSAATACMIKITARCGQLRLVVANDGAGEQPGGARATLGGGGRGLPNLTARVQAAGGQLFTRHADGLFELDAEIPLECAGQPLTKLAESPAGTLTH